MVQSALSTQSLIPFELDAALKQRKFLNPVQFDLDLANLLAAGASPEDAAEFFLVPLPFIQQLLSTPRFARLVQTLSEELASFTEEEDPDEFLERQKRRNFRALAQLREHSSTGAKEKLASIKLMLDQTPSIKRAALEDEVIRVALTTELSERFKEGWVRSRGGQPPSQEEIPDSKVIEGTFTPIFEVVGPLQPQEGKGEEG